MKKIEKLQSSDMKSLSGEVICTTAPTNLTMMNKINEIIDILNQEVSQPEEKEFAPYFDNDYRCPECQEELLVTCKHPLELYCACCQRKIDLDEMGEELTFVKETLPNRKVKNNTEERSFSKEELETIKQIIDTHDGHGVGYEALSDILKKVDRLLSLEK